MCGEKHCNFFQVEAELGSPPHVRGKVMGLLGTFGPVRITPACAGKSRLSGCLLHCSGDHPRMCGEKLPLH